MKNTLAMAHKIMPNGLRITIPPVIRFLTNIHSGDWVKIWITDDQVIHMKKLEEKDGMIVPNELTSTESIVELLKSMPAEERIKVIKGIAPPCFIGGV